MFQVFMIIGWAALLILLLYVWADVREIVSLVKDSKRELIRSNFGGRTSGRQQSWMEEYDWRGFSEEPSAKSREPECSPRPSEPQERVREPRISDEQVLQEVLTEFLG